MENTEKKEIMVLSPKITAVAEKLNHSIMSVIGRDKVFGFEKAYLVSNAITEIKTLLTPEYMKPIMELQGNKLGFKSDKVYSEDIVKNCLIEAVLYGLQPTGNQFNIIAGNMYATKEGCGYLLSKIQGLNYDIIPELPRIKDNSGAVVMNVEWTLNGVTKTKKIDIPIKVNNYMGTDAVIGKATRKARKWLFDTITGSEIPEGDISDLDKGPNTSIDIDKINYDKERERILNHIKTATTEELNSLEESSALIEFDINPELITERREVLKSEKKTKTNKQGELL